MLFVLVTFAGRFPVFVVTHSGYIVAFVDVSSVMPMFVALVAVVAVAAFPPILSADAVPLMFVPTSVEGVPRFGVVNVALVSRTKLPVPPLPEYSFDVKW